MSYGTGVIYRGSYDPVEEAKKCILEKNHIFFGKRKVPHTPLQDAEIITLIEKLDQIGEKENGTSWIHLGHDFFDSKTGAPHRNPQGIKVSREEHWGHKQVYDAVIAVLAHYLEQGSVRVRDSYPEETITKMHYHKHALDMHPDTVVGIQNALQSLTEKGVPYEIEVPATPPSRVRFQRSAASEILSGVTATSPQASEGQALLGAQFGSVDADYAGLGKQRPAPTLAPAAKPAVGGFSLSWFKRTAAAAPAPEHQPLLGSHAGSGAPARSAGAANPFSLPALGLGHSASAAASVVPGRVSPTTVYTSLGDGGVSLSRRNSGDTADTAGGMRLGNA